MFFCSGALGLGYELLWIKQAALLVGATQLAMATVLTSFFCGLALGALVTATRLRTTRLPPMAMYGAFELGVGVFALCFAGVFDAGRDVYGALHPLVASAPWALSALRFSILFVMFLFPTFLMGGTLPLLLDGLGQPAPLKGWQTSLLYGVNILGAVGGVLATSYWAIPTLGMKLSSQAGGVGNLLLGGAALLLFRRDGQDTAPAAERPPDTHVGRRVLGLSFFSGLISIGYQVAWGRYFSLYFASTVHRTAVLLAVYLLALGVGSMLLAPMLARRFSPWTVFSLVQPCVAVATVVCLPLWRLAEYNVVNAPEVDGVNTFQLHPTWCALGEVADALWTAPLLQTALTLFLPVVLLGMGLPCILAAVAGDGSARVSSGKVLCANTLGCSAGGLVAGYVLIPGLGLTGCMAALCLGSTVLGLAARWRRPTPRLVLGTLVVVAAAGAFSTATLWSKDLSRTAIEQVSGADTDPTRHVVDVVDGPLTTAFVLERAEGLFVGSGAVRLAGVAYNQASPQAIEGHLPILFYPPATEPRRALGICLGSGQSVASMLMYPLEHLDVVDISQEMVAQSLKHFAPYQHNLGTDPRVTFHVDDGRHFVERAPAQSYDVVSMEPPPPANEGVFTLYSEEFYREVRRVLRPEGVFIQWLPIYMTTPLETQAILRTQVEVFPSTFVVKMGPSDFMVMSILDDAPRFHLDTIRRRLAVFSEERKVHGYRWLPGNRFALDTLEGVLSLIMAGPREVASVGVTLAYHDDDQQLSYGTGDSDLAWRHDGDALCFLSAMAMPRTPFVDLQAYFDEPLDVAALEQERAEGNANLGVLNPLRFGAAEREWRALQGEDQSRQAMVLASMLDRAGAKDAAMVWVARAVEGAPALTDAEYLRAARRVAAHLIAYSPETGAAVDALARRWPDAPVARVMVEQVENHRRYDAAVRSHCRLAR
jgi:spermidine synthase